MKITFNKQNLWPNIGLVLVGLLYLVALLIQYRNFDPNPQLGYLDPQLYWQSLSDLAAKKVIYRDFFWEYGFLYLALGLPFFLLLGKTFLASVIIRIFILPLISIFLSVLVGRELLKNKALILFLFLLLIYGTSNEFTSLRHLLPELALILLFVGLETDNHRKALLGSALIGLSLTSSIEYGAAAIISIGCYFLIATFRKGSKPVLGRLFRLSGVAALVAIPYFLFLWRASALNNFLTFTLQYANSFYHSSPCRELFPRLNEINLGLMSFLRRLNLYVVPLVLIGLLGGVVTRRKSQWLPVIAPLLVYSLLVFYRTLNTPCLSYMSYGLTFLFLILIIVIAQVKEIPWAKIAVSFTILWFITTAPLLDTLLHLNRFKPTETTETRFLPIAGVRLKEELAENYQEVINAITGSTQESDYIFVYPNGPYYQLADRKAAVSIASTWYYDLVPQLIGVTYKQLEENKPKLIIINTYNAWSLKSALNQIAYNIHTTGEDIIFEGILTPVEEFISQNYKLKERFELAWILERREQPKQAEKLYLPAKQPAEWQVATQGLRKNPSIDPGSGVSFLVDQENPVIQIGSEILGSNDLIKIPIKVDLGIAKPLSKFMIELLATSDSGKIYLLNRQIVSSDWQDVWAYLPKNGQQSNIDSVIIQISDNKGFFWWGRPKSIEMKLPEIFMRNQSLEIDESAF